MNKILIGLTLLLSMSSFASCEGDYANVTEPNTREVELFKLGNKAPMDRVVKVKETIREAYEYINELYMPDKPVDYIPSSFNLIQELTEKIVVARDKGLMSDYVVFAVIKADEERALCKNGLLDYDSFVSTVIKHMEY